MARYQLCISLKLTVILWICPGASAFTQDYPPRIVHESLGFSFRTPPYFREKEANDPSSFFQGIGLLAKRESINLRFELVDKAKYKSEVYPGIADELLPLEAASHPQLANRKGIPPRLIDQEATNTFQLIAWVEYDRQRMAKIEYFWFKDDPAWMLDSVWNYFRSFQLDYPQDSAASQEDEQFYHPVALDPSSLAPIEGKLARKIRRGAITVEGGSGRECYDIYRPALTALSSGNWVLGWVDADGNSRLQLLTDDLNPIRQITLPGERIMELVAMDKGFAGIVARPDTANGGQYIQVWLGAWDDDFNPKWTRKLAGDADHAVTDAQWLSPSAHHHDLHWDGEYLGVYLATKRHCPDGRYHQGDWLRFFDAEGNQADGENYLARWEGWRWGVSHSFGQELAADKDAFYAVAVGDAFPRGIVYTRGYPLEFEPGGKKMVKQLNAWPIEGESGDNDVRKTRIAGLHSDGKEVFIAYVSGQGVGGGEDNTELGLMRLWPSGRRKFARYVHSSPQREEVHVSMVPYAASWLFVYSTLPTDSREWSKDYRDHYLLVGDNGHKLEGPVDLDAFLPRQFARSNERWHPNPTRYFGTPMVASRKGDWLRFRPLADGESFAWIRVEK